MLVKLDKQIEVHVSDIMRRYPRLVDTKKGRSVGDPFVIAVAQARKLTVITGENATGKVDRVALKELAGFQGDDSK
jgi:PIN domain nuclease of toxin-antitoxin system